MSVRHTVDLLRQAPLFAHVEAAQLQLIAFSGRPARFAAGECLIRAGEAGDTAFLVLEGRAEAFGADGEPIATVGPGALVGELQMIARAVPSITVRATTEIEALGIDQALFMRVLDEFPETGAKLLGVLSRKLDGSVKELQAVQRLFEGGKSPR